MTLFAARAETIREKMADSLPELNPSHPVADILEFPQGATERVSERHPPEDGSFLWLGAGGISPLEAMDVGVGQA